MGASASNCESGLRGAGNGKPPDGWSEGSAGVVDWMFGLLGNEEVRFLAVHRHAVHPCQTDAVIVVVEPDQEVIELGSIYHSVPMVLPMHRLAGQNSLFDLVEFHIGDQPTAP